MAESENNLPTEVNLPLQEGSSVENNFPLEHNLPITTTDVSPADMTPSVGLGSVDEVLQGLADATPKEVKFAPMVALSKGRALASVAQFKLKEGKSQFLDYKMEDKPLYDSKPSFYNYVDKDETHAQIGGKFIPRYRDFVAYSDNEDRLARQDSNWTRWTNGVLKLGGKTLVNIIDGTVGMVNGIATGISEGSFNAVFNNNFSNAMDDLQTRMDISLPNYMRKEERNMHWLRSVGTANFWANDVLGGLAFTLGAIGTESVWAAATGGASLAVTVPKMALKFGAKSYAKALAKGAVKKAGKKAAAATLGSASAKLAAKEAAEMQVKRKIVSSYTNNFAYKNTMKAFKAYSRTIPASKAMRVVNNARFLVTSSGFEAGVEARHSLDESLETFIGSYEAMLGRPPSEEEMASFMDEAKVSSNKVFGANVALVGSSNLLQFGRIFGMSTGLSKSAGKSVGRLFGQGIDKVDDAGKLVLKAMKPKRWQKVLGTTAAILEKPFLEGVVEEGGQGVINRVSKNYLASKFHVNSINKEVDGIKVVQDAFHGAYGTNEGMKEVSIGMIIGFLGGGIGKNRLHNMGITKFSNTTKMNQEAATNINKLNDVITESMGNTLERLMANASSTAATDLAMQKIEEGNISEAASAFEEAQFAKMFYEAKVGMLGESVADFEHMVNNMTAEQFNSIRENSGLNLTEENAADYKEALISEYKQNAEVIEKSIEIAEALNPSLETGSEFFSEQSLIKEEFARNIFMGVKSAQRMEDIADTISEITGKHGMASAMRFYTNLSKKNKRRLERLRFLNNELANLQDEFAVLQQTFSTLNKKDSRVEQDGKTNTKANENRAKAAKVQAEILKKKAEQEELEKTLAGKFNVNKFAFGGKFNIMRQGTESDAVVSVAEQLAALEELESLDKFKQDLAAHGQEDVANHLQALTEMYRESMIHFRAFNTTYQKMRSRQYGNKQGLAKLLQLGPVYDEMSETLSEEAKQINKKIDETDYEDDVKFTLKTLNTIFASRNVDRTTKETREKIEQVSDNDFEQFEADGTVPEDVTNEIVRRKVDETPLTDRQLQIYEANRDIIDAKAEAKKLEEGDGLSVEESPKTITDQIKDLATETKKRIDRLKRIRNQNSKKQKDGTFSGRVTGTGYTITDTQILYKGEVIAELDGTNPFDQIKKHIKTRSNKRRNSLIRRLAKLDKSAQGTDFEYIMGVINSFEKNKEYSIEMVMDYFKSHLGEQSAVLYKIIEPFLKNSNTKIMFVANAKRSRKRFTLGTYSSTENVVRININNILGMKNSTIQDVSQTLVHELIHAITVHNIDNFDSLSDEQQQAVLKLEAILEHLKEDSTFANEYGITNIKELLAELSNPNFVEMLKNKSLPAHLVAPSETSVWESILNSILKLVGIKSNAYAQTLGQLYEIINDMHPSAAEEGIETVTDGSLDDALGNPISVEEAENLRAGVSKDFDAREARKELDELNESTKNELEAIETMKVELENSNLSRREIDKRIAAIEKEFLEKKKALRARPKTRDISKLSKFQQALINIIEDIKARTLAWSNYNPLEFKESEIPTERNYTRFKALTRKRATGNMSARELSELKNLEVKLNSWARLQGASLGGVTISQLLERLALSETTKNEAEEIIKELETLGELIVEEFSDRSSGRFYNILQSYDKAFVSTTKDSFSIHNLTVDGFLNQISNSHYIQVRTGNKGATKEMPKGGWKIGTFAKNQKITIIYPSTGVEVVVTKDEHGRLNMTTANKMLLEANSTFRMLPLQGNTAYNTLMRQVVEAGQTLLKPVDSDITFENGKYQTDIQAIFELKKDDMLDVFVAPNHEYNVHLRTGKNNTKLNTTSKLLIYLKDSKGRIVGVFKGISEFTSANDKNLGQLQAIRQSIIDKLESEDMTSESIDMEIKVPVETVYTGHPNITFQETDEGVFPVINNITEDAAKNITDIGFIENGKIKLKNNKKTDKSTFYVSQIQENEQGKYTDKKVPVVVFKFNGKEFVYPASLIQNMADHSTRLNNILSDTKIPTADKVLEIQLIVQEFGLDVDKYGMLSNEIDLALMEELGTELQSIDETPSLVEMMDSKTSAAKLSQQNMLLNIDITDKPLHSPKIRVNYSKVEGAKVPDDHVDLDVVFGTKTKKDADDAKNKKEC